MWLRGNLVLVLLLACLAQNVSMSVKNRAERKGKRQEGDTVARVKSGSVFKGRFSAKNQAQCTWIATGEKKYTLSITCNLGQGEPRGRITCEYTGDPTTCHAYAINTKGYWKQISRALKKQKELCTNNRAMLRAGMCKRAPLDAHFRLTASTASKHITPVKTKTVLTTTSTTATIKAEHPDSTRAVECTERSDHHKRAEETCGNAWASFCTFIFTIVQNGDC